ncbi:MAG: 23S rRNA (adenine(2503)-C(2))-methyltransferase RlmN [Oscillospiraceae bacterium]|nr:23S rRNA (adenine(2503)-C(2))-methyltransferase RlmN [Oscillospiraceae bacterium]
MEKTDILSLSLQELETKMLQIGKEKYRAKQIFRWLHLQKATDFDQMTDISAQTRDILKEKFCINSLKIQKRLVSAADNTVKYLYVLPDGNKVETVLMEYRHGNSICLSTQVGCKMGCKFCASTKAGFVRDLTPSEILLQIYETERDSGRSVDSIVLMGIGEPLDNFGSVTKFLSLISDKNGRNMSLRHVSLSTCGLVDKINELAELDLGLTLSVSLHAPTDEKRSEIMPINRKYGVADLIKACKDYFDRTGRRISFEFALIKGVNDDPQTAKELITLLKPLGVCHVNLIPVNEIREGDYRKSSSVSAFQQLLTRSGINATVRRTLGADIEAACGQLRRDNI